MEIVDNMYTNDELTFYSLLIKFGKSGTMNNAVIAAEIVDCPIRSGSSGDKLLSLYVVKHCDLEIIVKIS